MVEINGQKTIVLPGREVMLGRLRNRVGSAPLMEQHVYPLLLRHAGEEKVAVGIVMMILNALYDIDKIPGLPFDMSARIFKWCMYELVGALVEDQEVKAKVSGLVLAVQLRGSHRLAHEACLEELLKSPRNQLGGCNFRFRRP